MQTLNIVIFHLVSFFHNFVCVVMCVQVIVNVDNVTKYRAHVSFN